MPPLAILDRTEDAEGKARSRGNAVGDGFRVSLLEVVTDADVAERQAV